MNLYDANIAKNKCKYIADKFNITAGSFFDKNKTPERKEERNRRLTKLDLSSSNGKLSKVLQIESNKTTSNVYSTFNKNIFKKNIRNMFPDQQRRVIANIKRGMSNQFDSQTYDLTASTDKIVIDLKPKRKRKIFNFK